MIATKVVHTFLNCLPLQQVFVKRACSDGTNMQSDLETQFSSLYDTDLQRATMRTGNPSTGCADPS